MDSREHVVRTLLARNPERNARGSTRLRPPAETRKTTADSRKTLDGRAHTVVEFEFTG